MYQSVTQEFENIIAGNSRTFRARLVCGDEILTGLKSLKQIGQANEGTDTISIGGAVSAYIEVSMATPETMVTGKEYSLEIGLVVGNGMEWVPMGLYTPQAPKESDGLITFTAYDRMVSKLSGPYFSDIATYPADGKVILQEIATKAGITIANLSQLPAGVMVSMRTQEDGAAAVKPFDGYTYKEAVKYLAQMYGRFATFNRTGQLELRWYMESGYVTDKVYEEPECSEKVYELQKITCNVNGTALEAGSGITGITIENPVMTQAILDSVYEQIGGMEYLPTTCTIFGDIRLDLGDIITVKKRNGQTIKVPVMRLTVDFDGGVMNDIGSYGNTAEEENLPKGPTAKALDRVYTDLFLVKEVLADKISVDVLEANYATIKQLQAVDARIDNITATTITVEYLEANYAKINQLNAAIGRIDTLESNSITTDYLNASYATILNLNAAVGRIDLLEANSITASQLETGYAKIDFANVNTATITQGFLESLMVSQGLLADKIIGGEIVATDVLTGVKIYANDIVAGTLSVERLILRGSEDSLVYALNNSGGLSSTVVDTLNGDLLTDRTITAAKIVAQSITGTEIAGNTITGDKIQALTITGNHIQAATIGAEKLKVGEITLAHLTTDLSDEIAKGAEALTGVGEVSTALTDTAKNIESNMEAKISASADGIMQTVSESYYDKGDVDAQNAEVVQRFSALEQTLSNFTVGFGNVEGAEVAVEELIAKALAKYDSYFLFTEEGLLIGKRDSDFILRLTNESIDYMQGTEVVAYVKHNKMYITDADIVHKLAIGRFEFVPRANGNLSMRWR